MDMSNKQTSAKTCRDCVFHKADDNHRDSRVVQCMYPLPFAFTNGATGVDASNASQCPTYKTAQSIIQDEEEKIK